MTGPDEQMALLPPAVGREPHLEHVPSHDVELIDPDGNVVKLGYRFERGRGWAADPILNDFIASMDLLRGRS